MSLVIYVILSLIDVASFRPEAPRRQGPISLVAGHPPSLQPSTRRGYLPPSSSSSVFFTTFLFLLPLVSLLLLVLILVETSQRVFWEPHRWAEVIPGVTVLAGAQQGGGRLVGMFTWVIVGRGCRLQDGTCVWGTPFLRDAHPSLSKGGRGHQVKKSWGY